MTFNNPFNIGGQNMYAYYVTREEVESNNFTQADKLIKMLTLKGKQAYGCLAVSFGGYDDDPRELSEIEEVRTWTRAWVERHPHLFYFANMNPSKTNEILMRIICHVESYYRGEILSDNEWAERGIAFEDRPTILFKLSIDQNLKEKLIKSTKRYAKSIKHATGADKPISFIESIPIV